MNAARAVRASLAALAMCWALLAQAFPPLQVAPGRLGQPPGAPGTAALWQRSGDTPFLIQALQHADGSATLRRHPLQAGADGQPRIVAAYGWDAGALLDAMPDGGAARRIHTLDGQGRTIAFMWGALDPDWRHWLAGEAGDADLGAARLAYLRGVRERERALTGALRARSGILGPIVHSVPLIIGAPAASEHGAAYRAFRERYRQRRMAVYIGANDGMLHAFAADTGKELFAYVPRVLGPRLPELTTSAAAQQSWVDASAGSGDVHLDGAWRSVLASGMGMGGRGLFALDVTDPEHFDGALWEFTERDDTAIGHLRAAPVVARIGATAVVIAASGLNPRSPDAGGALFLLQLDKPVADAWRAGVNYHRIDTAGTEPALPNALAPATLLIKADGSATHAYAGDLQGNLWRFDLLARRAHRIFTARDSGGTAQPITHAPALVFAPGGGVLVLFGTGKLLEQGDMLPPSFKPQTMYAIHDRPDAAPVPIRSRAQLAVRRLSGKDSYRIKGKAIDYFGPDPRRGWYFDFPQARSDGERAAGSPLALGGAILFDTVHFNAANGSAATRQYVIDAVSGLAVGIDGLAQPGAATGAIVLHGGVTPQLLASSAIDAGARDATGGIMLRRTVTLLRPGAGAAGTVTIRSAAGRMGWREVGNWTELHAKTKEKR